MAPTRGGRRPLVALGALAIGATFLGVAAGVSCTSSGDEQVTPPVDLGMTSTVAPYFQVGQETIYQVNMPVPLPVRAPTSAERQGLGPAPAGTPYPHAPFLTAGDESLEVHYVITNVDAQAHVITLLIDPWNEFVRWSPGVTVSSDDQVNPNLGYDISFLVDGSARIEGDLTQDDMHEIAIKLAAAENVISQEAALAASAADNNGVDPTTLVNHIFDEHNRSNTDDPLYTPWIPPVIAGLTGFDLGLRVESGDEDSDVVVDGGAAASGGADAGAAANIAVEITIQIVDVNGNRFVVQGSNAKQIGMPPMTISPPGARF